jgi:Na+:H+ antiporter, NhaA family
MIMKVFRQLSQQSFGQTLRDFLRLESASGFLLVIATFLAMIMVNSPLHPWYVDLLEIPVQVRFGEFEVNKPLLLWINDGLMAVFFFLVGLEIKREMLQGELSDPARVTLPVIGAVGGMLVPALIYIGINWGDPAAIKGWAIPSATDIAFALGVLSLLGRRVPSALKLFLLTLAIVDDLGAILVIAVFYTTNVSMMALAIAAIALVVLFILNRRGVYSLTPYLLVGTVLWLAVLKSGIHATLAGVILAFFIPLRMPPQPVGAPPKKSPLESLEHDLHPSVAYGILPLFAFANTGISLEGMAPSLLLESVPLGILLGLFVGKQIGVFGFVWVAVKLGWGKLSQGVTWMHMYGISLLCGVGFTMSLFISALAFQGAVFAVDDRIGILTGSIISAVAGYFILHYSLPKEARPAVEETRANH